MSEALDCLTKGAARMLAAAKATQDQSPQSELDRMRATLAERERLRDAEAVRLLCHAVSIRCWPMSGK